MMKEAHEIDLAEGADEIDEISGDQSLALVWCVTHQAWEWHWVETYDLEALRLEPLRRHFV